MYVLSQDFTILRISGLTVTVDNKYNNPIVH